MGPVCYLIVKVCVTLIVSLEACVTASCSVILYSVHEPIWRLLRRKYRNLNNFWLSSCASEPLGMQSDNMSTPWPHTVGEQGGCQRERQDTIIQI